MINFFENTVMAMQTGVGLSKILILAGAGYTGAVLLKNGKLSDILGELQSLVKGLEKSGEQADDSDALLAQVRRLSTESRQLASARQITVLNGDCGGGTEVSTICSCETFRIQTYFWTLCLLHSILS
ncbi:hypothetical protein V6Z11_D09G060000 [Gossypium hirsutum]